MILIILIVIYLWRIYGVLLLNFFQKTDQRYKIPYNEWMHKIRCTYGLTKEFVACFANFHFTIESYELSCFEFKGIQV